MDTPRTARPPAVVRVGRRGRHLVPIVQSLRRGGTRRMATTSHKRGPGTAEGVRSGRTAQAERRRGRALPDADAGRHVLRQTHRGRLTLVRRTRGPVGRLRPVGRSRRRLVARNPRRMHVGRRLRATVPPRTGLRRPAARDHRRIEGDLGQGKPIRDGRPLHARGHRTVDDHARRIRGETVRDVIRLGAPWPSWPSPCSSSSPCWDSPPRTPFR